MTFRTTKFGVASGAAALLMLGWGSFGSLLHAQQGLLSQVYPLRNASAVEAQRTVLELLDSSAMRGEVFVDPAQNALMVRGGEPVQQLVQQTLAAIDQPSARPQAPPTLQTYPGPADQLERMGEAVRGQFGPHGARVAIDPRNSQLLIVAPADVQPEIGRFLGAPAQSGPPNQAPLATGRQSSPATEAGGKLSSAATPAPRSPQGANFGLLTAGVGSGQIVQLHVPAARMQNQLQELWGSRFQAAPNTARDVAIYTVDVGGPDRLRLEFDLLSNQVAIHGPQQATERCARLLALLEQPPQTDARHRTQIVPLGAAAPVKVIHAAALLQNARQQSAARRQAAQNVPSSRFVAHLFQPGEANQPPNAAQPNDVPPVAGQAQQPQLPPATGVQPGGAGSAAGAGAGPAMPGPGEAVVPIPQRPDTSDIVGPVQIEVLEDLGVIVLRGPKDDVDRLLRIIQQIEETSLETEPLVEIYPLQFVNGESLATIVTRLYDTVYASRKGRVNITPLIDPNALLLVGPPASVEAAVELIKRLDTPSVPDAQFEVFKLKFASAQNAALTLQQFYGATTGPGQQQQAQQQAQLQGLFPRVNVVPDFRTNALIVRASPRDLAEIASLLSRLDIDSSPSELTLRVFQLRNSLAQELAGVLQAAITGGAVPGQPQQIGPQLPAQQQVGQLGQQQQAQRAAVLRLMTLDARERKILRSGILTDVQVTADTRANSVIVRAPADSMPLIEALVDQLDNIPGATAQIKVFTILNGDAESLVNMLSALFGQPTTGGPGGGGFGTTLAVAQADGSIVPLRFAVDSRTNSILATGSSSDLTIVEAVLLRLDESDVRERETQVYRLKNAPSLDVANSINQLLQAERAVQQQGIRSAFQQIQEEVVVVGEPVTNSLIVTATPRYFGEIRRIIDELDRRPPMVMIQVLIGEVQLNNTDEFGVELGLQDSILFDRSLLGDLITTTESTQVPQGNTVVTATNQVIQGASLAPGFLFNNQPLGNSGSDFSRRTSNKVAGQALSSFSVGRVNSQLGYGGLVLSASNESISILIRALQECRRLDVLSRPQVMTLDNQPAFIQVGQRIQLITSSTFDQATGIQTNQLGAQQNVGLILGVTPRISPDGLVVMEIDVEKSEVGPESEGIPVSVLPTGDVIRSPRINTTLAQSTVSAISGQTIVLGGLITKSKAQTHRRVPLLASIPVLGHLFRYDANVQQRTELLIILTPRVVRDEADMELIKQVESARMHWVLSDVRDLHGESGIRGRGDAWEDPEIPIIYPHTNPSGRPEAVPSESPGQDDAVPGSRELPPPLPQPPGQLRPVPDTGPSGAAQRSLPPQRTMPPGPGSPGMPTPGAVQPAAWQGPPISALPQLQSAPPYDTRPQANYPPAVQPAYGTWPESNPGAPRAFPLPPTRTAVGPQREIQSPPATHPPQSWREANAPSPYPPR